MPKEKYNCKLLVEGKTDQHVVYAICEQHKINESFDVIDCENISNVLAQLPVRVKEQTTEAVGVIVDADQNLSAVWLNISKMLTKYNYQFPPVLPFSGYVHPKHSIYPALGVWIMPDNASSGMLEDFAKSLIPDSDVLKEYVNITLQNLEALSYNRYNKKLHKAKAYIHTYLAWQEDPGTPIGLSITKHYFDHNAQACITFVEWLNKLYNSCETNPKTH